ncbi:unnamed protein product [Rotaria socialis]|uniref:Uncharacterized protein n=5 Tax=Rotaria socialis TaxID=392032 RepID=A0A820F976_9BILA|nr:unnamed protein product [Rotaria socialis]
MLSRATLDVNPRRSRNGWIPLVIIIFIMIVLLFVAICIVFTLLPIDWPYKNFSVTTTNGKSTILNVRYITNGDLTGKTVANAVNLDQQLSTQLGLPSRDSIQTYVEPSIENVNPDALSAAIAQPNITYHENPVMKSPVAYVVWYGNWTGNSGVVLIEKFLAGIGSTSWWGMATQYTNGSNITFGQSTYDNYSQGTNLNQSMVFAIVTKAISSQALPFNENGIYFVLTSSDVNETEFCTSACGWHSYDLATKLIYSCIGNSELQCPQSCSVQQTSPNGNFGADAMASVIAHEAMEATTDPFMNAWFDSNGEENADKCAWTFGKLMRSSNGAYYNMIVGGVQFLIQQNWNLFIQNCSLF